jgi:hypothetical protein
MVQSPWARDFSGPSIKQQERPKAIETDRYDDAVERVTIWGNSHINEYLFDVIAEFPDINAHLHLLSSRQYRTTHYHACDAVKDLLGGTSIDDALDTLSDNMGGTLTDVERADALKTISDLIETQKSYGHFPSPQLDTRYVTSLYAVCMSLCADLLDPKANAPGFIHPAEIRNRAKKAQKAADDLLVKSDIDACLAQAELGTYDNFIQTGYRYLTTHIQTQLEKLRHHAPDILRSASEDFADTFCDIDACGNTLQMLQDILYDTISAHEWPEIYEYEAFETAMECNSEEDLPNITPECGAKRFIKEFISANGDVVLTPRDAMIVASVFKDILDANSAALMAKASHYRPE